MKQPFHSLDCSGLIHFRRVTPVQYGGSSPGIRKRFNKIEGRPSELLAKGRTTFLSTEKPLSMTPYLANQPSRRESISDCSTRFRIRKTQFSNRPREFPLELAMFVKTDMASVSKSFASFTLRDIALGDLACSSAVCRAVAFLSRNGTP